MTLHDDNDFRKRERETRSWEDYSFLYRPVEVEKGTSGAYEHEEKWYKDRSLGTIREIPFFNFKD